MTKKVWSVILLCAMAALLIVLCVVGVEMRILDEAFKGSQSSDDPVSGTSFFAGVLEMFLVNIGATVAILLISLVGFALSCVNVSIAPNKAIKYVSVGFLTVYSVPALMLVIRIVTFLLPF